MRQCLAKDPDERWQTASDLGRELVWIAESGSRAGVPARARRAAWRRAGRLAWAVAVVLLVLAGVYLRARVGPGRLARGLRVLAPPNTGSAPALARRRFRPTAG